MPSPSASFVVIAEFLAPAENLKAFLELCKFDAERSVADEEGCSQFVVQTAEEDANRVVLYEQYTDRAAFDVHVTMPHFVKFDEGLKQLNITTEKVRFFTRQS